MLTRVCKLGGSLLDDSSLAARLRSWLAGQTPASTLLIVGGGRPVDAIQDQARIHGLCDEAAHWLCIQAMGLNTQLLRSLLPEAEFMDRWSNLAHNKLPLLVLLDTEDYLRGADREMFGGPLPASWDVTSDSIAARVATALAADELVLLKSALPPEPRTIARASETGYVDRFFPRASEGLNRIRCVNLRDAAFAEATLEVAGEGGRESILP